ncbi:MAG: TIGR00296 family protein [Desulfurococcaceae archaeon]
MKKPVHPSELKLSDGTLLVKIARRAVEERLLSGKRYKPEEAFPEIFTRPGMVFTTIETYYSYSERSLRGCIGFLQPVYPLIEAVISSALEAAFNDPRFPPLERKELKQVTFEVTVLSMPEPLLVEERWSLPKNIVIGKHGIYIKSGWLHGTLLPQVPIEYCWDEETFLAETCVKAGMEPDCWLEDSTEVMIYEGKGFREVEPEGSVEERDLVKEYRELCKQLNRNTIT